MQSNTPHLQKGTYYYSVVKTFHVGVIFRDTAHISVVVVFIFAWWKLS